jgi:hypothetical protein
MEANLVLKSETSWIRLHCTTKRLKREHHDRDEGCYTVFRNVPLCPQDSLLSGGVNFGNYEYLPQAA